MAYINIVEAFPEIDPICHVSTSSNIITSILRTLSGTVRIENIPNNDEADLVSLCNSEISKINTCHFERFSGYNSLIIASDFYKAISDDININDYKEFSEKAIRNNIGFFKTLQSEILYCLWNRFKGRETNAFIHIYRILEHISYVFPLLYISKTNDFVGTYNKFKSFYNIQSGDQKGELGFFKTFLTLSLKETTFAPFVSLIVKFCLIGEDEYKKRYYTILCKSVDENQIKQTSVENETFEICWPIIPQLIINLRNKYFHYTNRSIDNISSEEIVDSDLFFGNVNHHFIKWFSTLFVIILNTIYDNIM
jgi:hypothetical protein